VVPLRSEVGTRLKSLETMALRRRVVSTQLECGGLEVVGAGHLCIADTAEQFAEKTLSPLTNEELIHRITNEARDLVVNRYDLEVIA